MTELYLYKRRVESLFQLLGYQENDISCAIACALANCPFFLREFLAEVVHWTGNIDNVVKCGFSIVAEGY